MSARDWINRKLGFAPAESSAQDIEAMLAKVPELEHQLATSKKTVSFVQNTPGVPIHKFTDYTSYLLAGCSKCWAAYKCADIIANVVVSTAFKVTQDGKPDRVKKVDPNLDRLLKWPNPQNSWEEMIYQWTFHMLFTGCAYWLKDMRNGYGQPTFLYALLPQYVSPVPDANSGISGYRYRINGHDVEFDVEDIIHFRRPHPMNPILGLGAVEPAEALFNNFINADSYEQRFMENGAQPGGVMILGEDTIEDETMLQRIKKKWNDEYGGVKNAGRTAWINGKWTYQQLGMTHRDMQKLEAADANLKQIFMNFGVPLSIIGVENAAAFATAKIDQQNFRTLTCEPLINNLCGKLNGPPPQYASLYGETGLIQTYKPTYKLDYDRPIDEAAEIVNIIPLVTNGLMSRNEGRARLGLEKSSLPQMDDFFVPSITEPIEIAGITAPTDSQVNAITDPARLQAAPPANDGTMPPKPDPKPAKD